MSTLTHRELYPEQYSHPMVGKRVAYVGETAEKVATVERVVCSRFGMLAQLSGTDVYYPLNALKVQS